MVFRRRNVLVTFHPVTLDRTPSTRQFAVLLDALDALGPDVGLIFTKPNADPEGRALMAMLDAFVAKRPNAVAFRIAGPSPVSQRHGPVRRRGRQLVIRTSGGAVAQKPAVNIGNRQAGRLRAKTVIDCPVEVRAITRAMNKAFSMRIRRAVNPYGDGHAAERIMRVLRRIRDPSVLLHKSFRDSHG